MPEVSLIVWNDFLRNHPQSHFLQTGEWGDLKSQYGWEVARLVVGRSGAQMLFRSLPFGLRLAYLPKVAPGQLDAADALPFWREVDAICRARQAVACKFEIDGWEGTELEPSPGGFAPSPHSIQPRRTIVVDLRPEEDSILGRMRQKCRYNIRLAQKKGVSIRAWRDIPAFHAMLQATGTRDGFAVHSLDYYRRAYDLFHDLGICELLVAELDGQALATLMVFRRGARAWYVYGGSTELQREKMPNYLLQWEAMRWAKERGCTEYDLWGVPDDDEVGLEMGFADRNDGLWGVYRFKRGFGGKVRRAAPSLDQVFKPLLYRLYLLRATGRMAA